MRLTNVARMTLPAGEVHSYALHVADEPGRRLPVSFDQGRHVGGGDRDGSWMSIAFRLPEGTARDALADAWHRVVRRHGTLRTAFTRIAGTDELALHDVEVIGGRWRRHPIPSGALARDVLRVVLDAACRPFSRPSHLLVVVEPDADAADRRPAVVIGSDHAHVDMWSLLVLVRDLIAGLDGALPESAAGDTSRTAAAVEPFAVHTALLAARPPAPTEITARWREILDAEGGTMPLFPLPLGDLSQRRPAAVDVRDVLTAAEMERFTAAAHDAGVGAAALAMSALTHVTRALAGAPLRAVFPVHSRFEQRWHDAVGWFITNSVIECRDADPAACAAAVRQAVALGSHPLAPILAPYGGMPVAPGMFALSWLDTRRLPVDLPPDLQIQYVSSVIESDDVMVWFVVNDSGLHLRYRCPDTPEATASVVRWVDAATTALRVLADAEVAVA
jgi:hypothetical protein